MNSFLYSSNASSPRYEVQIGQLVYSFVPGLSRNLDIYILLNVNTQEMAAVGDACESRDGILCENGVRLLETDHANMHLCAY